jgi:uncharacterized protein YkwD
MATTRKFKYLIVALSLWLFTGCGGGGALSLTDGGEKVYVPPVIKPTAEVYQELGSWKASCFDTVPAEIYQNATIAAWADTIFAASNKARLDNGVPALKRSSGLDRVEQAHCRDGALRHYFGHYSPEGYTPWERLDLALLKDYSAVAGKGASALAWKGVAENAAMGQESAQQVVNGWLTSPSHRESLLNPRYTHVGTAVYYDPTNSEMPIRSFQLYVEEKVATPAS